ncbi:hypothetical protein DYB25_006588 [Aphanomyces astaci]|uniref:Uncharacterized protein n=1 Tax=Aphanomyces astaci TaxID=112090 RepID=A0A397CZ51_APHAT|nr:hypothetical protein DYB25_006588 [Aphanomyces astaci]RHY43930.1 hypothetical protein DYB34_007617 [Aphanomyces astaci]RHY55965.1 hypothetical protein DYB38_004794 [Aphanomyces astaci]RHY56534.1 hypothetical protein DYB30_010801 [Aphanomyces astaci]RHY78537.1 hypothetical protein DYB31_007377 [Aphanomyces astaci]
MPPVPSIADAYSAGIASDAGVATFADLCAKKVPSRGKESHLTHMAALIVPEAELKRMQGDPHEKVRRLKLQVLCRLGQAAIRKTDPVDKSAKKTLYSILSSMAMKMDSMAMSLPEHDDADGKSAFTTFVLDTLSSRFQSLLPKTFKWLLKTLEISPPNDHEAKKRAPSLASRSLLFQEIVLTSSQPKTRLPAMITPMIHKVVLPPSTDEPTPCAVNADVPIVNARHTMVLKTPERPKRPPMKKRLVCVASSPPLRKPTKKRLGTLMSSFK